MKEGEETNLGTNILIIGKNIIAIGEKNFTSSTTFFNHGFQLNFDTIL